MRGILRLFGILFLLFYLIPLPLFADASLDAYQKARECYVDLKANPEAQKLRQNWETCIREFDQVSKKYSRQVKGPDAQYSLGKLYEELAGASKNQADWLKAIKEYETFASRYSRNSMADDAYFASAKIHWEKFNHKREAKGNLLKVIKFYKTGDRAGEAGKYLDLVEKGIVPKSEMIPMQVSPAESSRAVVKAEEKFVVVIDPGHGGTDTGAIGPKGTKEKNITLSLSKQLADQISRELPNTKVYLTRTFDKTLTLDDRVNFANTKNADFFISIHANASNSKKQHGIQTYFLNNASDDASARLAAQENKNSGKNLSDLDKIISTMVQNASTVESREFGRVVHKSLVSGLSRNYSGVVDQKLRSALFYVLVGVKCPSILVETSYISNPKEENLLKNKKYQAEIANSVADGVEQYIKNRKSMAINL